MSFVIALHRLLFIRSAVVLTLVSPMANTQVEVLTQHNDNARTGANLKETILNPTTDGLSAPSAAASVTVVHAPTQPTMH